jgi:hypothetical protein
MNDLVASVKPTGTIGVVGVFLPADEGAPTDLTKQGKLPNFDDRIDGWTKVILKP